MTTLEPNVKSSGSANATPVPANVGSSMPVGVRRTVATVSSES